MKIAVFSRAYKAEFESGIKVILDCVNQYNGSVIFNSGMKENITKLFGKSIKTNFFSSDDNLGGKVDLVISFGGDGTLLETVNMVKDSNIPILGINFGKLGFLSNTLKEDLQQTLDDFANNKTELSQRSLLTVSNSENIFGKQIYALNDIVLCKSENNTMITTHLYLNDIFVNSYWSDGLILSTPTGSTAYSLSCGGPILSPEVENIIITPIAPHNMSVRPLIINDRDTLKLIPDGRSEKYILSLDTNQFLIQKKQEIIVKKAPFKINFIKQKKISFFETMRDKLMWGIDKRN